MTDSSWENELTKPDPVAFPASFEAFLAQYEGDFLRIAYSRLRNVQDAEDAVMEAAYQMYRKWDRILAHSNPRAMAYRMLKNSLTDFYRRRAREARREEAARSDPPTADDLMEMGQYDLLDAAMDQLEATAFLQANCVRLRHMAGLAYDDVAQYLDITPGAAKTNVSLGLAKLRDLMNLPEAGKGDS
ncbi:RNA polymerase sigma factor [Streptomyces globosus]|uniref:RNA polymerase sigma factor n=1 Tax=Streptomyces globosus TaxID=68209 RepID=UPI001FE2FF9B|nr:sigma-70 family RNA polymerase sigma factor [Streptomyces globosus]